MELADVRFVAGVWLGRVATTDTTNGQSIEIDFFAADGAWQIRAPRRTLEENGAYIANLPNGRITVALFTETAAKLNRLLSAIPSPSSTATAA